MPSYPQEAAAAAAAAADAPATSPGSTLSLKSAAALRPDALVVPSPSITSPPEQRQQRQRESDLGYDDIFDKPISVPRRRSPQRPSLSPTAAMPTGSAVAEHLSTPTEISRGPWVWAGHRVLSLD